jgi:hypothetical protein
MFFYKKTPVDSTGTCLFPKIYIFHFRIPGNFVSKNRYLRGKVFVNSFSQKWVYVLQYVGRPRSVHKGRLEDEIFEFLERDRTTSTRCTATQEGTSSPSVYRKLQGQQLSPYHIRSVQALVPHDATARRTL